MPAEDMGDGISQAVLAGTKTGYADDTIAGSADDAPEAVAEEGDLESAVDDPGEGDLEGAADATGDAPAAEQIAGSTDDATEDIADDVGDRIPEGGADAASDANTVCVAEAVGYVSIPPRVCATFGLIEQRFVRE